MVVWGVSDYSECSECSIYQGSHRFNKKIRENSWLKIPTTNHLCDS